MNYIVLHGLGKAVDSLLLEALELFALDNDIAIALVDTSFSLSSSCKSDRILLFELAPYLASLASLAQSCLYPTTRFHCSRRISETVLPAFQRMGLRFPYPQVNMSQLECLATRLLHDFESKTPSFEICLLNLAYEIPHSCIDFLFYTLLAECSLTTHYLRSTGLYPELRTLHQFHGWDHHGQRAPSPIVCSSTQIILDHRALTRATLSLLGGRRFGHGTYQPNFQREVDLLYKTRKTTIFSNLDAYSSAIDSVAKLRREYDDLSLPFASKLSRTLPEAVVYFLHREPEASTCPEALPILTQYEFIAGLRARLPTVIPLYVKEHPQTFRDWETLFWPHIPDLSAWRPTGFYRNICELPNTFLLPITLSTRHILDSRPLFVATLTGSVYSEAISHRVPCLALPDVSYSFMSVVGDITSECIVEEADRILEMLSSDPVALHISTLSSIEEYTLPLSLRTEVTADEYSGALSRKERIHNFFSLIGSLL
jgi:hypothetical protein